MNNMLFEQMEHVYMLAGMSMLALTAMMTVATLEGIGDFMLSGAALMASLCLQMWYTMEACDESNPAKKKERSRRTACAIHMTTTVGVCTDMYYELNKQNGWMICTCGFISILLGYLFYAFKKWDEKEPTSELEVLPV